MHSGDKRSLDLTGIAAGFLHPSASGTSWLESEVTLKLEGIVDEIKGHAPSMHMPMQPRGPCRPPFVVTQLVEQLATRGIHLKSSPSFDTWPGPSVPGYNGFYYSMFNIYLQPASFDDLVNIIFEYNRAAPENIFAQQLYILTAPDQGSKVVAGLPALSRKDHPQGARDLPPPLNFTPQLMVHDLKALNTLTGIPGLSISGNHLFGQTRDLFDMAVTGVCQILRHGLHRKAFGHQLDTIVTAGTAMDTCVANLNTIHHNHMCSMADVCQTLRHGLHVQFDSHQPTTAVTAHNTNGSDVAALKITHHNHMCCTAATGVCLSKGLELGGDDEGQQLAFAAAAASTPIMRSLAVHITGSRQSTVNIQGLSPGFYDLLGTQGTTMYLDVPGAQLALHPNQMHRDLYTGLHFSIPAGRTPSNTQLANMCSSLMDAALSSHATFEKGRAAGYTAAQAAASPSLQLAGWENSKLTISKQSSSELQLNFTFNDRTSSQLTVPLPIPAGWEEKLGMLPLFFFAPGAGGVGQGLAVHHPLSKAQTSKGAIRVVPASKNDMVLVLMGLKDSEGHLRFELEAGDSYSSSLTLPNTIMGAAAMCVPECSRFSMRSDMGMGFTETPKDLLYRASIATWNSMTVMDINNPQVNKLANNPSGITSEAFFTLVEAVSGEHRYLDMFQQASQTKPASGQPAATADDDMFQSVKASVMGGMQRVALQQPASQSTHDRQQPGGGGRGHHMGGGHTGAHPPRHNNPPRSHNQGGRGRGSEGRGPGERGRGRERSSSAQDRRATSAPGLNSYHSTAMGTTLPHNSANIGRSNSFNGQGYAHTAPGGGQYPHDPRIAARTGALHPQGPHAAGEQGHLHSAPAGEGQGMSSCHGHTTDTGTRFNNTNNTCCIISIPGTTNGFYASKGTCLSTRFHDARRRDITPVLCTHQQPKAQAGRTTDLNNAGPTANFNVTGNHRSLDPRAGLSLSAGAAVSHPQQPHAATGEGSHKEPAISSLIPANQPMGPGSRSNLAARLAQNLAQALAGAVGSANNTSKPQEQASTVTTSSGAQSAGGHSGHMGGSHGGGTDSGTAQAGDNGVDPARGNKVGTHAEGGDGRGGDGSAATAAKNVPVTTVAATDDRGSPIKLITNKAYDQVSLYPREHPICDMPNPGSDFACKYSVNTSASNQDATLPEHTAYAGRNKNTTLWPANCSHLCHQSSNLPPRGTVAEGIKALSPRRTQTWPRQSNSLATLITPQQLRVTRSELIQHYNQGKHHCEAETNSLNATCYRANHSNCLPDSKWSSGVHQCDTHATRLASPTMQVHEAPTAHHTYNQVAAATAFLLLALSAYTSNCLENDIDWEQPMAGNKRQQRCRDTVWVTGAFVLLDGTIYRAFSLLLILKKWLQVQSTRACEEPRHIVNKSTQLLCDNPWMQMLALTPHCCALIGSMGYKRLKLVAIKFGANNVRYHTCQKQKHRVAWESLPNTIRNMLLTIYVYLNNCKKAMNTPMYVTNALAATLTNLALAATVCGVCFDMDASSASQQVDPTMYLLTYAAIPITAATCNWLLHNITHAALASWSHRMSSPTQAASELDPIAATGTHTANEQAGSNAPWHQQQPAGTGHCQTYAVNNCMGGPYIEHSEVLRYRTNLLMQQEPDVAAAAADSQGQERIDDDTMDAYLHEQGIYVRHVSNIPRGEYSPAAVAQELDKATKIFNNSALLIRCSGHALAARKVGRTWWLLDSNHSSPTPLLAATNAHLYYLSIGTTTICALQTGEHAHIYCERQVAENCLVHATNNALGKRAIAPEHIHAHCDALMDCLTARNAEMDLPHGQRHNNLDGYYNKGTGRYSASALNHYLYRRQDLAGNERLTLTCVQTQVALGNMTSALLEELLARYSPVCQALHLFHAGHASVLKKVVDTHGTTHWYHIDSMAASPLTLNSSSRWNAIQGDLYVLLQVDIHTARSRIPHALWLADPQEPFNPVVYMAQHAHPHVHDLTSPTPANTRATPPNAVVEATSDSSHPEADSEKRQDVPAMDMSPQESAAARQDGERLDENMTDVAPSNKSNRRNQPTTPGGAAPSIPARKRKSQQQDNHGRSYAQPTPHSKVTTSGNQRCIAILTWNIRGMHASREDMANILPQIQADIIVLTETKLHIKKNGKDIPRWFQSSLPDYQMWHAPAAQAGVLLAIKKDIAMGCRATLKDTFAGRGIALTLSSAGDSLLILATYWPSGSEAGAMATRTEMEVWAEEHLEKHTRVIMAGDMNATAFDTDRDPLTAYPADRQHRALIARTNMRPLDEEVRARTYLTTGSRIDDILVKGEDALTGSCRVHDKVVGSSDHAPLIATMQVGTMQLPNIILKPPAQSDRCKLCTPVSKEDTQALHAAADADPALYHTITDILAQSMAGKEEAMAFFKALDSADARNSTKLEYIGNTPGTNWIDDLAQQVAHAVQDFSKLAYTTLKTQRITPGGTRYNKRTVNNKWERAATKATACRIALAALKNHTAPHQSPADVISSKLVPDHIRALPQNLQGTKEQVTTTLKQAKTEADLTLRHIRVSKVQEAVQKSKLRFRHMLATKPKRAHQQMFGKAGNIKGVPAIITPDGVQLTEPADILHEVQRAWGQKLQPPAPKTGMYLPNTKQQTVDFPWEKHSKGEGKPMVLTTGATTLHRRPWLHESMADPHLFHTTLQRLSSGKAPGPDGIPNEILKLLPASLKAAIHNLFLTMWACRYTPDAWKTSTTALLHKGKGKGFELNAYRPITMANTMYKLYTAMVDATLRDYAERHAVFSSSQAGFRQLRCTEHQLQLVVTALEDACMYKRDIFALLVDLTDAFNTIDQDKLLQIMYALGYPTDGIDVVKDLYTGATTRFSVNGTLTAPISVDRGTLQGDSLSPLLFNIYIEPLLRWLHRGGQGYMPGCVQQKQDPTLAISAAAFADDLLGLTGTMTRLKQQADKITQFCDWAALTVSAGKTYATCAPYRNAQKQTDLQSTARHILCETDGTCRIVIQGKPVQYLCPTQPFTYLGVHMTMTLDWKHQHTKVLTGLRQRCEQLRASYATAPQVKKTILTCIIPSAAYCFPVVPFKASELATLDSILASTIKQAYGLWRSAPTAMVHASEDEGGLGCPSLTAEYRHRNVQAIRAALDWKGTRLGEVSQALTTAQLQTAAALKRRGALYTIDLSYAMRLRQLACTYLAEVDITNVEGPVGLVIPTLARQLEPCPKLVSLIDCTLRPLLALGIQSLGDLLIHGKQGKRYIMDAATLKMQQLAGTRVTNKHVIALNRLCKLVKLQADPTQEDVKNIRTYKDKSRSTPLDERLMHPNAGGVRALAITATAPNNWQACVEVRMEQTQMHQQAQTGRHTVQVPPIAPRSKRPKLQHLTINVYSTLSIPQATRDNLGHYRDLVALQLGPHHMTYMYENQDQVMKVVGVMAGVCEVENNCEPARRQTRKRKGNQAGIPWQKQYKVEWAPTIIHRMSLPYYCAEDSHHKPIEVQPMSRADAPPQACTCEICFEPAALEPRCLNCARHYHTQCLTMTGCTTMIPMTEASWLCPVCEDKDPQSRAAAKEKAHAADNTSELVACCWPSSYEKEELFERHADYAAKLAEYIESEHQLLKHRAPDQHLPESKRQGLRTAEPKWQTYQGDHMRAKVQFTMEAVQPQYDTQGTGYNTVTERELDTVVLPLPAGLTLPSHQKTQAICVHNPRGKFIGATTKERATHLLNSLLPEGNAPTSKQPQPAARCYADELAAALARGRHDDTHTGIPIQAWDVMHAALGQHGITERHTTSLARDHRFAAYCSPYARDTVFGSKGGPMHSLWEGISLAIPPADSHRSLAATKHAVCSAMALQAQGKSALVVLLLCAGSGRDIPGYHAWLERAPMVMPLATFKAKQTAWTAEHWHTAPAPKTTTTRCYHMIAVYNANAHIAFPGWTQALQQQLQGRSHVSPYQGPTLHKKPAPWCRAASYATLPSTKADLCSIKTNRNQVDQLLTQPAPPLQYNWQEVCYTDGSRHVHEGREVTGAGSYAPAADPPERATLINPRGQGVSNTILRAELAGILTALRQGYHTIATDSATSLWLIRRAILAPMTLQTHLHRRLLQNIVDAIKALTPRTDSHIHLFKVKAHSGVIGNECADTLAKQAAEQGEACDIGVHFQQNPFEDRVWVQRRPQNTEDHTHLILPNCGAALKQHILKTSHLGTANAQSIYYQLWQAVATVAAPGSLAQVMKDSSITAGERRLALQYRNGNLYNQKHAFRCKKAPNANCPNCGNPDSATHILQGPCTAAHSGMVSNRHHGAVGLIAKAILKGDRGGDLRFADISDKVAQGIGLDVTELDGWKDLQPVLTRPNETPGSRPDLLLLQRDEDTQKIIRVTIVEVKYCADTSWLQRYEQAQEQHAALQEKVCRAIGARPGSKRLRTGHVQTNVDTVVLLLGAAGTTYRKYTLDPLTQKLGLDHARAKKLLAKLTRHSLRHAVMLRNHRYTAANKQPG
jgi:exonuclease III/ribonuclease HI